MAFVSVSESNGVVHVRLNRPEFHNAFDAEMIQNLTDTFFNLEKQHPHSRCVLLTGEGPSFCAGADLKWMQSMVNFSFEENCDDANRLFSMFEAILKCRLPIVAKVHGNIMGGGLGILAVVDIVGAQKETKFCFSEVKLGLVPSIISGFFKRRITTSHLRPLMLTGEVFGVDRAQSLGIVHFSGEAEEVEDFVQGQVDFIKNNGSEAVRALKSLLLFEEESSWDEVRRETVRLIAERRVSREGQEGLKAFLEKRKPTWRP